MDACLNIWFLRVVRVRLVRQNGLKKYGPLVRFNMRMMFISVLMDVRPPPNYAFSSWVSNDSHSLSLGHSHWTHVPAEPNGLHPVSPGNLHREAQH